MFPRNSIFSNSRYKGAIPYDQFEQNRRAQQLGQLDGHAVKYVQGAPVLAVAQANLPGAMPRPVLQPGAQPASQWVRSGGPAPHPVGQPMIGGQRPQPAHQWVRANHS